MGYMKFIDNAIEQKMKDLHTAYLGKVVAVKGKKATVQPLGLIKEYGENAKKQAVVSALVAEHCKNVAKNDIVMCICFDRNIADAQRGKNTLPPAGHHSLSDSAIIGVYKGGA